MKISPVLLTIFIFISGISVNSSCTRSKGQEDLYGVWQGSYHEADLVFEFNSDNSCSLSFSNNSSGEKKEYTGTYKVDFSKSPTPLAINNIPQLSHGLYTIVKFPRDGSLVVAEFASQWRLCPIAFDKNSSMSLNREH